MACAIRGFVGSGLDWLAASSLARPRRTEAGPLIVFLRTNATVSNYTDSTVVDDGQSALRAVCQMIRLIALWPMGCNAAKMGQRRRRDVDGLVACSSLNQALISNGAAVVHVERRRHAHLTP